MKSKEMSKIRKVGIECQLSYVQPCLVGGEDNGAPVNAIPGGESKVVISFYIRPLTWYRDFI